LIGIEVVAGYLLAWLIRKASHVGKRVDEEVDHTLDLSMDRVHKVVSEKLGSDSAVAQLEAEAHGQIKNDRTLQRVQLAIDEAADTDPAFRRNLIYALEEARDSGATKILDHGMVAGRDIKVKNTSSGVAAGMIQGSVHQGDPPSPGQS